MGRAVSLFGAVFALLCFALVLCRVARRCPGWRRDTPWHGCQRKQPRQSQRSPEHRYHRRQRLHRCGRGFHNPRRWRRDSGHLHRRGKGDHDHFPGRTPEDRGSPGDFIGNHARFPTSDDDFDTDGDYLVVSSTGVTGCRGGDAGGDDTVRRRTSTTRGSQIILSDMVPNTSSNKQIPDTGGPPYLAFGALLLMVAALLVGRGVLRP